LQVCKTQNWNPYKGLQAKGLLCALRMKGAIFVFI